MGEDDLDLWLEACNSRCCDWSQERDYGSDSGSGHTLFGGWVGKRQANSRPELESKACGGGGITKVVAGATGVGTGVGAGTVMVCAGSVIVPPEKFFEGGIVNDIAGSVIGTGCVLEQLDKTTAIAARDMNSIFMADLFDRSELSTNLK